jgi:hypothetical protein
VLLGNHVFRSEGGGEARAEVTSRSEGSGSGLVEARRGERSTLKSLSEAVATGGLSVDLSRDFQMFREAFNIFGRLDFLASEARMAAVEVVVHALSADPAVFREFETFVSPFGLFHSQLFALSGLLFLIHNFLRFLSGAEGDEGKGFRGRLFSFGGFNLFGLNRFFFLNLLLRDDGDDALCDLLSDLVLLAGLYLGEDSVTASGFRALCVDGFSVEIGEVFSGFTYSLGLTWFSSSLFLGGFTILILSFIVGVTLGELGDEVLVGMVAVLVLDLLSFLSVKYLV